jgi:uncharacterized protein
LHPDDSFCGQLLETYAGTYLREEIQAEALVQNIQGFSRFLTEAGACAGRVLDYSKIAAKTKISRTSCVRFFEILQDTLMVDRCDVFTEVEGADIIRHPKFFFFDVGVRNALTGSFDLAPERKGLLFEHFIYNQIKNSAMGKDRKVKIEYFRTRSGLEVDFVVTVDSVVWAIEVKAGEIRDEDIKSLRAFADVAVGPIRKMAVGLRETAPRKSKGVIICDWRTMLAELKL